jgi:uncharacterized protein
MTGSDTEDDPAPRALDVLDGYFNDPSRVDDVMTLAELDGFLTALAIGPEGIEADEWLPVIWNDDAPPQFAEDAQEKAVLRAIVSRHNDILRAVVAGVCDPIFDVGDAPLPESWAVGFMTGAGLRIDAWRRLFESEEDDTIAYPILAFCEDEAGEPLFDLSDRDRKFLIANAPELIAQAVLDIADYWKREADPPPPAVPVRTGPKIGRNDPCPCGSGKKYKKCCGP